MNIAKYTFNSSTDTLPTFNIGYNGYNSTEIDLGIVYAEETINIGVIPSTAKIVFYVGGNEFKVDHGTVTVFNNYIRYIPLMGLEFYHYIDGTESRVVTTYEPAFMMGMTVRIVIELPQYTDINNGDGTITRTIISNVLPSSISFTDKTGLISVSYLNTSNVTDMSNMFSGCTSLTSLDLSYLDTSNVTDMSNMFSGCSSLTSLDLSNFNTSKVTNMSNMFNNTSKLKYIGLLHSDANTINNIKAALPSLSNLVRYIYTLDTPSSTFVDNKYVKFVDYRKTTTSLYLSQPLRRIGNVYDRLYWDNNRGKYCIEKKISDDGTTVLATPIIIELSEYNNKIEIETYNPISCIYTDGKDTVPSNITVEVPYID